MTLTDPLRQDERDSTRPEVPLRLADTSELSAASGAGASRTDAAPARSASDTPTSSATTGGFETLLGAIVVSSGLCTQEEVDACTTEVESRKASADPLTLADALMTREFVTRHQLVRLKSEFEAKKSSRLIPGFQIQKKLGAGAMATVFLARQLSLDRLVAIKILPKKFSGDQKFIERFYKEGRAAAQLNHPNIVAAYDVGAAGDHHYFVMEYVDGHTVFDHVVKHKRFKEREAIDIVKQVAKALEHAHARGFVHRDIKPKNIMITRDGRVKLADLGLARAMSDEEAAKAEAGRAYGTPYYISPEQIRGELEIGPAADIYGLGATLYHMVTGRVPFEGKNPSAVMKKHLTAPLEPPDHVNPEISAGCAQVIEMMMAKSAGDRYRSAKDLIEDLELIAQGKPPHFAHRALDHASMTETLTALATAAPTAPAAAPRPAGQRRGGRFDDPVFLIVLVLLVVSGLANLLQMAL